MNTRNTTSEPFSQAHPIRCALFARALALCTLVGLAPFEGRGDTAANQFDSALVLLTQAEKTRDAGESQDAIALFDKAFQHYMSLSEKYPTWQPQVTRFRMNYAKDQMQLLLRRGGWLAPSDKPAAKRSGPATANTARDTPAVHTRASRNSKGHVRELIQAGDAKGARALLLDALMKFPDDVELRLLTATAQCIDGQYEDALFILDELALDQPGNTDIIVLKGAAFTGLGDLKEARKHLEQAIALNADLHEAHFNLAGLYLAETPPDKDLALAHYERALKLGADPDVGIAAQVGYEP